MRFGAALTLAAAGLWLALPARGEKAQDPVAAAAASALARPHATPEQAAVAVLETMRERLRYDPGMAPRGPHEWTAAQALSHGTFNGCVEAAKVFFAVFRRAFPALRETYIDSFDAAADGGHAVVEVAGGDGKPLLIDTASFERLPGPPVVADDDSLSKPVDIQPDRVGRVVQLASSADLFLEKAGGRYRLTVYEYGRVFHGKVLARREFPTLAALNAELARMAPSGEVDFRWIADNGLLLRYLDERKRAFLYYGGAGGLTKHVVYGCYSSLPEPDPAQSLEPRARDNYRRAGDAGTCDRSRL